MSLMRAIAALADRDAPEEERLQAGDALGRAGDPRLTEDQTWAVIPERPFFRGAVKHDPHAGDDERPMALVHVSAFAIGRWPVVVGEYARFLDEGAGYHTRAWWSEEGWTFRERHAIEAPDRWIEQRQGPSNVPVTSVSWWEAEAYCRWRTAVTPDLPEGQVIRLPTEAEWERAARGGHNQARIYPWGNMWVAGFANAEQRIGRPTPVGCFPGGHGPHGTWDQTGNVWEHCLDWYDPDAYRRAEARDPASLDEAEAPWISVYDAALGKAAPSRCRVLRGGSFYDPAPHVRVSRRGRDRPAARSDNVGFRCARGAALS